MKALQVTTPSGQSRYALDTIRAVHSVDMNTLAEIQPEHAGKWLLVVEQRPIKALDPAGSAQVIDHCQQKEWLFDSQAELDAAVEVVEL